jgi:hypothetical protein
MLGLAQPQLLKWARCSTGVFLRCLCSKRSRHRILLFPRITMSRPLPRESPLHLVLRLYIKNSLEVEEAGVSPSEHPAYLAPALHMFGLLSVVFSGISHHPPVRFLGQARLACKTSPRAKYFDQWANPSINT